MRLGDLDALRKDWLENGENEYIYNTNSFLESIDEQPTVDPVHAAGACYCEECEYWHKDIAYCEQHSHFVDSEGLSCSPAESLNWTMFDENDFCSYGKPKEKNT